MNKIKILTTAFSAIFFTMCIVGMLMLMCLNLWLAFHHPYVEVAVLSVEIFIICFLAHLREE